MAWLRCLVGHHTWQPFGKGEPITVGGEFVIGWRYERRCARCGKIEEQR